MSDNLIMPSDWPEDFKHDLERLSNLDGPVHPFIDHDSDRDGPNDADPSDTSGDSGAVFDLFDPAFFGIDSADWPVDAVDDKDALDRPSIDPQKFDQAEKKYLSFARKREGRQALKKITVDDFDTREERVSFLAVEKHKTDLFGHKSSLEKRKTAIEWFFCHADDDGLTFPACCSLLDSRPDVLRLRIHYEFWLRWMIFAEEFPFMTVPVPEIIRGEVMYNAGINGVEVAQEAWMQPGLTTETLLMRSAGVSSYNQVPSDYKKALDILESNYSMSVQHEAWYLTGRNPLLQRLDQEKVRGRSIAGVSVHWSKLFYTPKS